MNFITTLTRIHVEKKCRKCTNMISAIEYPEHIAKCSKVFPCPVPGCGRLYNWDADLKDHMLVHQGPINCVCGRHFAQTKNRRRHQYKCPEFLAMQNSSTHIKEEFFTKKLRTAITEKKCKKCDKIFPIKEYREHLSNCYVKYACDVCKKTFKWDRNFKAHMLKHQERAVCICGKHFTLVKNMRKHQKRCLEFREKQDLSTHINEEEGGPETVELSDIGANVEVDTSNVIEKKCRKCTKIFPMDAYKEHVEKCSKEYACQVPGCGKMYIWEHNLKAHMLTHQDPAVSVPETDVNKNMEPNKEHVECTKNNTCEVSDLKTHMQTPQDPAIPMPQTAAKIIITEQIIKNKCRKCHGEFSLNEYRAHVMSCAKKHVCIVPRCGRMFLLELDLRVHMQTYHPETVLETDVSIEMDTSCSDKKCRKCGDVFTVNAYKEHIAKCSKEYPCEFPGCGKVYLWDFDLKAHMQTHKEPAICICGKKFAKTRHMKIHQNRCRAFLAELKSLTSPSMPSEMDMEEEVFKTRDIFDFLQIVMC